MKKYIISFLLVGLLIWLVGYPIGKYIYIRILEMISSGNLLAFYEYGFNYIDNEFQTIILKIVEFIKSITWNNFVGLLKNIFSFNTFIWIVYALQILLIIVVMLKLWVSCGSNKKYKTSKCAKALIKLVCFIKNTMDEYISFLKEHKKRTLLVFLICTNLLLLLIFEFGIFLVKYMIAVFTFSCHVMLFSIIKFLVVKIVDFVLYQKKFIVITTFIVIYILLAVCMSFRKLKRNWGCFKKMIRESATVNCISGEPGAGKTLTLSQAAIAQTEIFIDDFERMIIEFELTHPDFNFALVRLLLKVFYLDFDEKEFDVVIKSRPQIFYDMFKLHEYINTDVSRYFFNEYYRGTNIASFTPITDPYYSSMSRLGSVQAMRFYKKIDQFPWEPYMSIIFPEYDKEFNSHDDKQTTGEDGTFAFFALISHLLERCGSVWLDTQDKDQGIRRIRAVAGGFYHLTNRKVKMPVSLKILYKPCLWIYNGIISLALNYLGNRPKTEKFWTVRHKQMVYRRNNLGLLYQIVKYLGCLFNHLVGWFEKFQYFKIYAEYATNDEFRNAKMIHYQLNVMDFYHEDQKIYSSTPFKKFYDDLKSMIYQKSGVKQNLFLLEKWSSLDPSIYEFARTGQRAYSKIVLGQFDD